MTTAELRRAARRVEARARRRLERLRWSYVSDAWQREQWALWKSEVEEGKVLRQAARNVKGPVSYWRQ